RGERQLPARVDDPDLGVAPRDLRPGMTAPTNTMPSPLAVSRNWLYVLALLGQPAARRGGRRRPAEATAQAAPRGEPPVWAARRPPWSCRSWSHRETPKIDSRVVAPIRYSRRGARSP